MSKEDYPKEWLTTEEVIASELPFAPRSRSGVSRLVYRLRYEQPTLIRRAGRGRSLLIHISAFDVDSAPPSHVDRLDTGMPHRSICQTIRDVLPRRTDGSRPGNGEIAAALFLLGYRSAE